ncbi:MAG: YfbU family protein [Anaerolineaceae bacterium]|nr:YfbU family protein [Anaerolineaceae bacterium]
MAQIFLSYSHSDSDFVKLIEPRIARIFGEGLLWYDRSRDGLRGGQMWWNEIRTQIQYCQIFLFLLSDESAHSKWCTKELEEAALLHKTIIPVLLETYSSKDYPSHYSEYTQHRLDETHYVDLRSKSRFKYDDLSLLWGSINQAQRPELSITERWLLWNQHELLRHIRGDFVSEELQDQTREQFILSSGWERHYFYMAPFSIGEDSPFNDGEEVIQILEMFFMITNALIGAGRNEEKIEVPEEDRKWLIYRGFRENAEYHQYHYAKYLYEEESRFERVFEQVPEGFDLNSIMERLPEYRRMLTAWRKSVEKTFLTREDLLRIADEAKPPHWKFENLP